MSAYSIKAHLNLFTSLLPYFILSCVFSRTRKLDTEDELYDIALRALTRRAHSVHEMQQKLARRTDNELLVRVVMARLKENGQLDDDRYARQFARNRTQSRKQGKSRIARDLRSRGVSDRTINTALEESTEQADPTGMIRQRIERKLKSYRGEIDDKKIASIYGSLLRAGFPSDMIRKELKAMTREPVPEVPEGGESEEG
jgi:regulatory protein